MTNFTDLYSKILATIPTLTGFNTKTKINDPYNLENNNTKFLRDGWGVTVGSDTPLIPTYKIPDFVSNQEFTVVLTRAVPALSIDSVLMETAVLALKTDLNIIEKDFTTTRFGIADKVQEINISTITSIENIFTDKNNHITASITFNFLLWR